MRVCVLARACVCGWWAAGSAVCVSVTAAAAEQLCVSQQTGRLRGFFVESRKHAGESVFAFHCDPLLCMFICNQVKLAKQCAGLFLRSLLQFRSDRCKKAVLHVYGATAV